MRYFWNSSRKKINKSDFKKLALLSRERGKDFSGFLTHCKKKYLVIKFNRDIKDGRLITNSTPDNQPVLREGDITRKEALKLVKIEGKPRFENIKWFLQILHLDFKDTINIINSKKLKF